MEKMIIKNSFYPIPSFQRKLHYYEVVKPSPLEVKSGVKKSSLNPPLKAIAPSGYLCDYVYGILRRALPKRYKAKKGAGQERRILSQPSFFNGVRLR
jgi:hypothetical protein